MEFSKFVLYEKGNHLCFNISYIPPVDRRLDGGTLFGKYTRVG
jgi:hypothetical protein